MSNVRKLWHKGKYASNLIIIYLGRHMDRRHMGLIIIVISVWWFIKFVYIWFRLSQHVWEHAPSHWLQQYEQKKQKNNTQIIKQCNATNPREGNRRHWGDNWQPEWLSFVNLRTYRHNSWSDLLLNKSCVPWQ